MCSQATLQRRHKIDITHLHIWVCRAKYGHSAFFYLLNYWGIWNEAWVAFVGDGSGLGCSFAMKGFSVLSLTLYRLATLPTWRSSLVIFGDLQNACHQLPSLHQVTLLANVPTVFSLCSMVFYATHAWVVESSYSLLLRMECVLPTWDPSQLSQGNTLKCLDSPLWNSVSPSVPIRKCSPFCPCPEVYSRSVNMDSRNETQQTNVGLFHLRKSVQGKKRWSGVTNSVPRPSPQSSLPVVLECLQGPGNILRCQPWRKPKDRNTAQPSSFLLRKLPRSSY